MLQNRSFSSLISERPSPLSSSFFQMQQQLSIHCPGVPTLNGAEQENELIRILIQQNMQYGKRLLNCMVELKQYFRAEVQTGKTKKLAKGKSKVREKDKEKLQQMEMRSTYCQIFQQIRNKFKLASKFIDKQNQPKPLLLAVKKLPTYLEAPESKFVLAAGEALAEMSVGLDWLLRELQMMGEQLKDVKVLNKEQFQIVRNVQQMNTRLTQSNNQKAGKIKDLIQQFEQSVQLNQQRYRYISQKLGNQQLDFHKKNQTLKRDLHKMIHLSKKLAQACLTLKQDQAEQTILQLSNIAPQQVSEVDFKFIGMTVKRSVQQQQKWLKESGRMREQRELFQQNWKSQEKKIHELKDRLELEMSRMQLSKRQDINQLLAKLEQRDKQLSESRAACSKLNIDMEGWRLKLQGLNFQLANYQKLLQQSRMQREQQIKKSKCLKTNNYQLQTHYEKVKLQLERVKQREVTLLGDLSALEKLRAETFQQFKDLQHEKLTLSRLVEQQKLKIEELNQSSRVRFEQLEQKASQFEHKLQGHSQLRSQIEQRQRIIQQLKARIREAQDCSDLLKSKLYQEQEKSKLHETQSLMMSRQAKANKVLFDNLRNSVLRIQQRLQEAESKKEQLKRLQNELRERQDQTQQLKFRLKNQQAEIQKERKTKQMLIQQSESKAVSRLYEMQQSIFKEKEYYQMAIRSLQNQVVRLKGVLGELLQQCPGVANLI